MRVAVSNEAEAAVAEESSPAIDAILGANPFVGLDANQIMATLAEFLSSAASRPDKIANRIAEFGAELLKIAAGGSNVEAEAGDKRFADPTWAGNPFYRRMMQTYLAWRAAMHSLAVPREADGNWKLASQQRFAVTLLTEALAPTNTLIGNPAALKRAFETGGKSLIAGARNFMSDLWNNGGMPSQVDKRSFKVGENLAVTPGSVVWRNQLIELIQYAPSTRQVYERPLLIVPPQINKYYVLDLAPKRSLVEHAVAHGMQIFVVSWRNPGPQHRDWGLDDYIGAIKEAMGAALEITGSPDLNLLAVCAGGITSSLMLGHLAASGDRRVNAATLLVTMLDSSQPSMTGMFTTEENVRTAATRSQQKGVLDGASMARIFAWLRPNDLVWHYWVNNYLMGQDPAPFDILYWNSDSTNLPARLHAGFLDILLRNPLVEADKLEILGTPINLRNVSCDMYMVAGLTDHICAWRACHRAARLFGGRTEFVLNSSGHVQSIVAAPGNFKSKYLTNARLGSDADHWFETATEHKGTWWDHWLEWLGRRAGEQKAPPAALGSEHFPPMEAAPGTYVHQRP